MTLPRKKSKPIHVDGIDYRYIISTSRLESEFFSLNVTIQIAHGEGAVLSVKGLTTRNFWLDFPDIEPDSKQYKTLSPAHIAQYIKKGIAKGWNPEIQGRLFTLEVNDGITIAD
ncbi:MAG: hypothetical protein AB8F95_02870 [Bacteroidia bacterium]